MSNRVGVCIIGSNGAVATTLMAGVALMKKGLVPRQGMITEGQLGRELDLVPLEGLAFSGWDLSTETAYEAAIKHEVVQRHLLDQVKSELAAIRPWPAVTGKKARAQIAQIQQDLLRFKSEQKLDRLVMVSLISTEKYQEVEDVHLSIPAFEAGLDSDDPRISVSMKYFYAACKLGIPHVNFTPSLTLVPALQLLAEQCGVPVAGEDGKTGQTLLKTVLAPALAIRELRVEGWYSTNILGNNDGKVLNDAASNKTKVMSKRQVLDSILGYKVDDHQVHIHYYRPRGDAKEAWDNIDVSGFLGERMQIKVNFLCKDSILAAPLVVDLARLIDLASRNGEAGIQRQLSLFFKAPYHAEGEEPTHDLFKQYGFLWDWLNKVDEGRDSFYQNGIQAKDAAQPAAF